jgi:hypothetical protein
MNNWFLEAINLSVFPDLLARPHAGHGAILRGRSPQGLMCGCTSTPVDLFLIGHNGIRKDGRTCELRGLFYDV